MAKQLFFNDKKHKLAASEELVQKYESTLKIQKERIDELKAELDSVSAELLRYKAEEDNIKLAIKSAVDKANQIENNARELYSLEIERLRLLYKKWDQLLNASINENQKENLSKSMTDFATQASTSISDTFKKEFNVNFAPPVYVEKPVVKNEPKQEVNEVINVLRVQPRLSSGDRPLVSEEDKKHVRILLDKMLYQANQNNIRQAKVIVSDKPTDKQSDKEVIVRRASVPEKQENLSELKSELIEIAAKVDTGFDLKEALNPIGDLEDIMKGFDFFDEITD